MWGDSMRSRIWVSVIKSGLLFCVICVMAIVFLGDYNRSRAVENHTQAASILAVPTVTPSPTPTIRPDYIPYPDELQTLPDFATLSPITDYVTCLATEESLEDGSISYKLTLT